MNPEPDINRRIIFKNALKANNWALVYLFDGNPGTEFQNNAILNAIKLKQRKHF